MNINELFTEFMSDFDKSDNDNVSKINAISSAMKIVAYLADDSKPFDPAVIADLDPSITKLGLMMVMIYFMAELTGQDFATLVSQSFPTQSAL